MASKSSERKGSGIKDVFGSMQPGIKRCSSCRKTLPKTEFHKNKKRYDGLSNECKKCAATRQNMLYRGNRRLRIRFSALSRRAERLGLPFHITFDEYCQWVKSLGQTDSQICPYCGLSIVESKAFQQLRGKKKICGFTIDRIDNEKGYTLDNIQRICYLCNTIKGLWFTSKEMQILGPQLRKIQESALLSKEFTPE
ncbi:MAG: hypothetical protein ACFFCW_46490 [Candidatus Hodarchaeota archaeon]